MPSSSFQVKNNQGEIDNALKTVSDKLSEVAANLQSALGPEGQKQAKEIKAKLDQGLKDAVAQAEKLTKAIEPEATSKYRYYFFSSGHIGIDSCWPNQCEVCRDLK